MTAQQLKRIHKAHVQKRHKFRKFSIYMRQQRRQNNKNLCSCRRIRQSYLRYVEPVDTYTTQKWLFLYSGVLTLNEATSLQIKHMEQMILHFTFRKRMQNILFHQRPILKVLGFVIIIFIGKVIWWNVFYKIKAFRRGATRYDKLAYSFLVFVCIVFIRILSK